MKSIEIHRLLATPTEGSDGEGEEEEESDDENGDLDGESEDEEGGRPGGVARSTGNCIIYRYILIDFCHIILLLIWNLSIPDK